ncbi:putative toxin-antitoxin system toxin component, PIN family [Ruficoccus amylovorans]|uniref:Putative toxin-antitoxin system toxin component, PIN family n=1 Tax=Ruficoccus amylovorans TaxID=1804625 RepID=A0A842HAK8_9BACT|nr:putative toxin-antitoxin system toxin component, PIN family [Ruficoccus amylovorans]MBC2593523.1 putative toxin-antitoxin system toxin component, PIN family [Ruficoccus amylovorans]
MSDSKRFVIDSNLLISRLLLPDSASARAVRCALACGTLLFSKESLTELGQVLQRPKFDRYLTLPERRHFLLLLHRIGQEVVITRRVQACRDPKDDMILEVALNGQAHAIITGDKDLLVLHPYLGVPILTAAQFLETYGSDAAL